jgi:Kef-type K+ transport system membrane component KefB
MAILKRSNVALNGKAGFRCRTVVFYAVMILATVLLFAWIVAHGRLLAAPPRAAGQLYGETQGGGQFEALPHVLLALAVVLIAARLVGAVFRRLGQPPVIGEVLAGILLGPSLLGRVSPQALAFLLPTAVVPFLGVIAQVGVILFMFLVGLELDAAMMGNRTHATVAISHASIALPFLLGGLLALWIYPLVATGDVPFLAFALFLGVSMSITAFPVLARILSDRGIQKTRLGVIALTCAAVDDVTVWCLLALVVSVVKAVVTLVLTLAYIAAILALRPLVVRLVRAYEDRGLTQGAMTVVFVLLLLSALATEAIGVHAIFGAFLLGAVVPADSRIARELEVRLHGVVVVLLLPAFFAYSGLRTQIGLVRGGGAWLLCAAIILVASAGKFGGTVLAARLTGLGWRNASALGVLMNTRGLVELIVLNIGLDLKIISPTLFAMLVIMALVTTMAATPILDLLRRGHAATWELPAGETGPAAHPT